MFFGQSNAILLQHRVVGIQGASRYTSRETSVVDHSRVRGVPLVLRDSGYAAVAPIAPVAPVVASCATVDVRDLPTGGWVDGVNMITGVR